MSALLTLLVACAAAAAVPAPVTERAQEAIVARAGTLTVSDTELAAAVRQERLSGDLRRLAEASTADGLERLARGLLERKLLAAHARQAGMHRQPAIAAAMAEATDRILAHGAAEAARAAVDESETSLRRYLADHADAFRSAPRRKARHIIVPTREEALGALADVRRGTPFSEVAARVNTDTTRETGGALGWVPRGVMVKAFEAALFALEPGAVSEPIQTSFGWHLATVEDIDPGTLPPFELVRDRVLEAVREEAVAALKARLWRGHSAVIDRTVLATLLK